MSNTDELAVLEELKAEFELLAQRIHSNLKGTKSKGDHLGLERWLSAEKAALQERELLENVRQAILRRRASSIKGGIEAPSVDSSITQDGHVTNAMELVRKHLSEFRMMCELDD